MTLTKICTKCKKDISLDNFHKKPDLKDGLHSWCKSCRSIHVNKDMKREYHKKYRTTKKTELAEYKRIYYLNNKEKIKKYYLANVDNIKNYRKKNISKIRKYWREYVSSRIKTDSNFKLIRNLRRRINSSILNNAKSGKSLDLLGCTIENLKNHLQKTAINNGYIDFDINNYSGKEYHIDHIVPCAAFDLSCSYHQKLCFNWNNLQILSVYENILKKDKVVQCP